MQLSRTLFHRRQLHLSDQVNLKTAELYGVKLLEDLKRDASGRPLSDEPCVSRKMRREPISVNPTLKRIPTATPV